MPKNKVLANFILQNNLTHFGSGEIIDLFGKACPEKKSLYKQSDAANGLTLIRNGYTLDEESPEVPKESRQHAVSRGSALDFASYVAKKGSRFSAEEKKAVIAMLKLDWEV